jgi:hypothetical protein
MANIKRESKKEFWARLEREGRHAEAEAIQGELLASGQSKRAAQAALVTRFQPTDGTKTRPWWTPDSWSHDRRYLKRPAPDSQEVLERDVQWVHANQGQSPEKAPTPGAKLLLKIAQERPSEFLKTYLKCLSSIVQRQKEQQAVREGKVVQRRQAKIRLAEAQKKAAEREIARQRRVARKQAAEIEEAARRVEAQKQEQERLERQREEAAKLKKSASEQPKTPAILTKDEEEWATI